MTSAIGFPAVSLIHCIIFSLFLALFSSSAVLASSAFLPALKTAFVKLLKLIGLNRHQSFPYLGYAMPKRGQKKDADLLKEYGLNIVRTSHYPQSRHFIQPPSLISFPPQSGHTSPFTSFVSIYLFQLFFILSNCFEISLPKQK
jgi:hypothetical protein